VSDEQGQGQERTEQPTGKRREDARREGRVPVSMEVTSAGALLGALGVFAMGGGALGQGAVEIVARGVARLPRADLSLDQVIALGFGAAADVLRVAWPLFLIPAVAAVAVGLLQTRFVVAAKLLRPDVSRVSPAKNLGRLLGTQGLAALAKAILKLVVVGVVGGSALRDRWGVLVAGGPDTRAHVAAVGQALVDVWLRVAAAWLVLAALDWAWQRWTHEKSLRMTKEEVRQESKETDGNPTLRSRLRSVHRQMATRRMMTEVPKADVVVRNPTHVAVALRYTSGQMRAPRVVAKGERLLALRIIDVARRHGVPVMENPPLARALFAAVDLGREVPSELYRAVAEVLAYVYRLRGRQG
jgi:flagellar biosynthetic protein FlhB